MDNETCLKAIDISEKELPKKIYAIYNGSYLDIRTHRFCYSEEEAQKICAYLNDRMIEKGDYPEYYYEKLDIYQGKTAQESCHPYCVTFDALFHKITDDEVSPMLASAGKPADIKPVYKKRGMYCVYCGNLLQEHEWKAGKCRMCYKKIPAFDIEPDEYKVTVYKNAEREKLLKIAQDELAKYLAEKEGL